MIVWIQEVTTGTQEVSQGVSLEQWTAVAQILSAVATVILAVAVFFQIRTAQKQADAARDTVGEMEESRLAQERPQVIVETDHSRPPFVSVVVRNMGKGAAKDVSFEFSHPVESPQSAAPHSLVVPVSEQPYFQQGIDYFAAGAEIPCLWGSTIDLAGFLRERELQDGITVTSHYQSLTGEPFTSEWGLNPLLIASRLRTEDEKGVKEIAEATEQIAEVLRVPLNPINGDLRIVTYEEQRRRSLALEEIRAFLKKLNDSGFGDPSQAIIERQEIESVGEDPYTTLQLLGIYINSLGYWFGEYEDSNETGEWTSLRLTHVQ